VLVEITVVRVVFVRFNITLLVEIILCVKKSHLACGNDTLRLEITLCVWKSHSAYKNHTRACWNYTLLSDITVVRVFITHKSDFYTQSVVLTRMNVIINFVSVIITLIRVNITLCVLKSHSACRNHTLRVEITLCV
jgi:hypothetical protein